MIVDYAGSRLGLAYAQFMIFFEDRFAAFVFTQLFFQTR